MQIPGSSSIDDVFSTRAICRMLHLAPIFLLGACSLYAPVEDLSSCEEEGATRAEQICQDGYWRPEHPEDGLRDINDGDARFPVPDDATSQHDISSPDGDSSRDGNSWDAQGRPDGNPESPGYELPPVGGLPDYQLGETYRPRPEVEIVGRYYTAEPARNVYSMCYIAGFQAQPGQENLWPEDVILRHNGRPVRDPDWPEEVLLDTSSWRNRRMIMETLAPLIQQCAEKGFKAVDIDKFDTYTRSRGQLSLEDNLALAELIVDEAHRVGLAAGHKDSVEDVARLKAEAGFDFAIAEDCATWEECDQYIDVYGDHVIVVEYEDNLRRPFQTLCRENRRIGSMVLRDGELRAPNDPDYIIEWCDHRR